MTLAAFNSTYQSALIAAVAKASGVSISQVSIVSMLGNPRRDLHRYVVVNLSVKDTDVLRKTDMMEKHAVHWEPAHSVHVRRSLIP